MPQKDPGRRMEQADTGQDSWVSDWTALDFVGGWPELGSDKAEAARPISKLRRLDTAEEVPPLVKDCYCYYLTVAVVVAAAVVAAVAAAAGTNSRHAFGASTEPVLADRFERRAVAFARRAMPEQDLCRAPPVCPDSVPATFF